MMLEMVDHLAEVMRQSFEVDRARYWRPSKVVMWLLVVGHLDPEIGACFLHDSFDQSGVIAAEDLILEESASLCLRQEVAVVHALGTQCRSHRKLRLPLHYQLVLYSLLDRIAIMRPCLFDWLESGRWWNLLSRLKGRSSPCVAHYPAVLSRLSLLKVIELSLTQLLILLIVGDLVAF